MPRKQPITSYTHIREFAEKFEWFDPNENRRVVGYNPPPHATEVRRLPYHIKVLTLKGKLIEGDAITLQVDAGLHRRNLMFLPGREYMWVYDMFIIEIDGVRFQMH